MKKKRQIKPDNIKKPKAPPPPPKPPLLRIIQEGHGFLAYPKCGSSMKRSFPIFGKYIGCIQPKCDNYYKEE